MRSTSTATTGSAGIDVLDAAYTRDEDQLQISRRIECRRTASSPCRIAIRNTGLTGDRAEMDVDLYRERIERGLTLA